MFAKSKKLFNRASARVADIYDNNTGMIVGTVGAGVAVVAPSAQAAYVMPVGITTAFTDMTTATQSMFDLALPVVVLGVVLGIVVKLLKKFGHKI